MRGMQICDGAGAAVHRKTKLCIGYDPMVSSALTMDLCACRDDWSDGSKSVGHLPTSCG